MLNTLDFIALMLTLKLAGLTTAILLLLGIPFGWWLAQSRWRGKFILEAVVALPLVLPPTVLGFYLLLALGPQGPVGRLVMALGGAPLVFSFPALVIGSVIYSLPFVVQPLQAGFSSIGRQPLEAAATLRAGPLDRFFSVIVPSARPAVITAAVMGFAHTLGEFGVVLMLGGNVPGKTQVLSIAIYDHVEALEYSAAHGLAGGLVLGSLTVLLLLYAFQHRFGGNRR